MATLSKHRHNNNCKSPTQYAGTDGMAFRNGAHDMPKRFFPFRHTVLRFLTTAFRSMSYVFLSLPTLRPSFQPKV